MISGCAPFLRCHTFVPPSAPSAFAESAASACSSRFRTQSVPSSSVKSAVSPRASVPSSSSDASASSTSALMSRRSGRAP